MKENITEEAKLATGSRRMPENGKEQSALRALLFFPSL
jgi:hypothetical protein